MGLTSALPPSCPGGSGVPAPGGPAAQRRGPGSRHGAGGKRLHHGEEREGPAGAAGLAEPPAGDGGELREPRGRQGTWRGGARAGWGHPGEALAPGGPGVVSLGTRRCLGWNFPARAREGERARLSPPVPAPGCQHLAHLSASRVVTQAGRRGNHAGKTARPWHPRHPEAFFFPPPLLVFSARCRRACRGSWRSWSRELPACRSSALLACVPSAGRCRTRCGRGQGCGSCCGRPVGTCSRPAGCGTSSGITWP